MNIGITKPNRLRRTLKLDKHEEAARIKKEMLENYVLPRKMFGPLTELT